MEIAPALAVHAPFSNFPRWCSQVESYCRVFGSCMLGNELTVEQATSGNGQTSKLIKSEGSHKMSNVAFMTKQMTKNSIGKKRMSWMLSLFKDSSLSCCLDCVCAFRRPSSVVHVAPQVLLRQLLQQRQRRSCISVSLRELVVDPCEEGLHKSGIKTSHSFA